LGAFRVVGVVQVDGFKGTSTASWMALAKREGARRGCDILVDLASFSARAQEKNNLDQRYTGGTFGQVVAKDFRWWQLSCAMFEHRDDTEIERPHSR